MSVSKTQSPLANDVSSDDRDALTAPNRREVDTKRGWTRTWTNFLLDTVLLLVFILLIGVSSIIQFIFPMATVAAGWSLWGWSLDRWLGLQYTLVAALALAVLFHMMLHWNWVCGVVANRYSKWKGKPARLHESSKTLWGVALLILIFNALGFVLAVAAITVRH